MLTRLSVLLGLLFLVASCQDSGRLERIEEKLKQIDTNGKALLIKLVSLERQIQSDKGIPTEPTKNPAIDQNKVYTVDIGKSFVKGNEKAPVTLVKWFDFQCPYCAQSVPLVDEIMKKYPNDVKVVFKNFPLNFHKQARKAAQYALAAKNQGKYLEMYHEIFKDYKKLREDENYPLEVAKKLGLDVEKLKKDSEDPAIESQIQAEMKELQTLGMARLSVPKFLINGKEPAGRDLGLWTEMIDSEIKKAKEEKKG